MRIFKKIEVMLFIVQQRKIRNTLKLLNNTVFEVHSVISVITE